MAPKLGARATGAGSCEGAGAGPRLRSPWGGDGTGQDRWLPRAGLLLLRKTVILFK